MLVSKQAYRRGTNPRWQGVPTVRDSFWVFCLRAPAFRHKFPSRAAWWMKTGGHRRSARGTAGGRGRRSRGGLFRPGRQLPLEPARRRGIRHSRRAAGLYLYQGHGQRFDAASTQLTITLNHQQEFSERVDVTYSPPAIDLQQPSDHRELANAEIQAIPYPAPQDYRNALPMMDGVVQDNAGRAHFNGGDTNQTNYTLDGFNVSDP